jgi:predicted phosphodiesterase
MKFGIFSDVHANQPALEAVLAVLRDAGARSFICAGDIVGYGPDPDACTDTIRGLHCATVAGNHDYASVGRTAAGSFSAAARQALDWTRPRLSEANRLYLDNLKLAEELDSLRVVHSAPTAPDRWEYVTSLREAEDQMHAFGTTICLIGHSHYPFAVESDPAGCCRMLHQPAFEIRPGCKYLVNAGSVGQPRDGDPRACGILYDEATATMTVHRVAYDIEPVQRRIRAAGLPESLAARLAAGR